MSEDPNTAIEEGRRLLELLKGEANAMMDSIQSAALLSYLARYSSSSSSSSSNSDALTTGEDEWKVLEKVALESLRVAQGGVVSGKMSRRIGTEGLLPLVSHPRTHDLIQTCVTDLIVPCCCTKEVNDAAPSITTMVGIELLLPSYLARLDNSKKDGHDVVDGILDLLCGEHLRPTAAAAVASSLREFETILPDRLSLRYNANKHELERVSGRLDSLLGTLGSSLERLVEMQNSELDSIPPLVYQMTLLSCKLRLSTDHHRLFCLRSIAAILESLSERNSALSNGRNQEEVSWVQSTSLTHIATCLRSDVPLTKALLQLVKGVSIASTLSTVTRDSTASNDATFRHLRLTPFRLSMALTMASLVPRTRQSTLEVIRDLICEEQVWNERCQSSPWIRCVAGTTLLVASGKKLEQEQSNPPKLNSRSIVCWSCLLSVVEFAMPSSQQSANRSGEWSSLLQSLVQLGFMLVDLVKKDVIVTSPSSINISQASHRNSAQLGRALLSHVFACTASLALDGLSSTGSGLPPLCRSILMMASDKFCGMAPNALEHSLLLRDLALGVSYDKFETNSSIDASSSADILVEHYIPNIIDYLVNVPTGGMPPVVALTSIIPTLTRLFQIAQQKRRRDLDDNIDHCFLLAKKALFCTDVERRKVAVGLLVMLLSVAITDDRKRTDNSDLLEEIQGYLRRCLTQHQRQVREEAYACLVSILPRVEEAPGLSPPSPMPGAASGSVIGRGTAESRKHLEFTVTNILQGQLDRFVTVEEDRADTIARRKRALRHGSQLSQHISENEEDEDDESTATEPPLRLEQCISKSSYLSHEKKGSKSQKGQTYGASLLAQAQELITEPLSHLLASCSAATSLASSSSCKSELEKMVTRLRTKMADSTLIDYCSHLEQDKENAKGSERHYFASVVSTCLLIASTAETLMDASVYVPGSEDADTPRDSISGCTIEGLFGLRQDAILKAATVISMSPPRVKKSRTKKKSKKAVEADDDDNGSQPTFSTEVKPCTLDKSRGMIEEVLQTMVPAMQVSSLVSSLNTYGATSDKKGDSLEEENDQSAEERLRGNIDFRRFMILRTAHLLSTDSLILKPGLRLDAGTLERCHETHEDIAIMANLRIVASFQLGPLVFAEFCTHCYHSSRTSLAASKSSSSSSLDLPLTLIALRSFLACIHNIAPEIECNHAMSRRLRVSTLIKFSFQKAALVLPETKDRWDAFQTSSRSSVDKRCCPQDREEAELRQLLFPFVAPPIKCENENTERCNLLTELVSESMDSEASEICELVSFAASIVEYPPTRQQLGIFLVRCWEENDENSTNGILGLNHCVATSNSGCTQAASGAIKIAMSLCGNFDCESPIPGIESSPSQSMDSICQYRSTWGISTTIPTIWTNSDETEQVPNDSSGICQKLSNAILLELGDGVNFDLDDNERKQIRASQLSIIESPSGSGFSRVASSAIDYAIDTALNDSEFIVSKALPSLSGSALHHAQLAVSGRLLSVAKSLGTLAVCAVEVDDTGSFAAELLKSFKRLYIIYGRLVVNHASRPRALVASWNRKLVNELTSRLTKRAMALLLTVQEKSEAGKGKWLAETKIVSQGKIAAQLVFEKERCDNALLKLALKLKADGHEMEYAWVETQVGTSVSRDFNIKTKEIKKAQEREAPRTKTASTKRKVEDTKQSNKKKPKTSQVDEQDDEDNSDSEQSMEDESSRLVEIADEASDEEDDETEDEDSEREAEFTDEDE